MYKLDKAFFSPLCFNFSFSAVPPEQKKLRPAVDLVPFLALLVRTLHCCVFSFLVQHSEIRAATASSVSLFLKRFHLRKHFILLLVILCFPITRLNPDYREHVSWSQASQTEELSVRCLWMWAVLQLFTQPVITPVWKR